MPGKMSNYLENAIINRVLRNQAFTPPATVYVGLCTAFDESQDGDAPTEVSTSGTAYARQAVTFSAASAGGTANSAKVTFPQATANWGASAITYFIVCDAATAGNVLYWGLISNPMTVLSGEQFEIAVGQLTLSIGTGISVTMANKILDHTLRNVAYVPPATCYAALFSAFTDDTTFTEVADANYARQSVTFSAPSNGATSNGADLIWPAANASYTASHAAVFDALSGGNLMFRNALTGGSKTVGAGKQFKVASTGFAVSID